MRQSVTGKRLLPIYVTGVIFISGLMAAADVPAMTGLPQPNSSHLEEFTSQRLPTGPFQNQSLPLQNLEGRLTQQAWQLQRDGKSSLELLAPLRQDLQAQGYEAVYECDTSACGGYDFRFNLSLLPEPDMHVDLGDFRYFLARKGNEWAALVVSNSANIGFIHLTHIDTAAGARPVTAAAEPAAAVTTAVTTAPPIDTLFDTAGRFVLEDLVFASGASTLAAGDYPSLAALAKWLQDQPDARVALVGHTDASGGLEANIALSRKRAEAVRQELTRSFNIPANRVEAQGVGPLAPRAPHRSDKDRALNRRVEAVLLGG